MPNWFATCWVATVSTLAWISLCGIPGLKTKRLGPKFGWAGAGRSWAGVVATAMDGAGTARAPRARAAATSNCRREKNLRTVMSSSPPSSLCAPATAALAHDEPDGEHGVRVAAAGADPRVEDVEGGRAELPDRLADRGQGRGEMARGAAAGRPPGRPPARDGHPPPGPGR